jgi:hypothetical protein
MGVCGSGRAQGARSALSGKPSNASSCPVRTSSPTCVCNFIMWLCVRLELLLSPAAAAVPVLGVS